MLYSFLSFKLSTTALLPVTVFSAVLSNIAADFILNELTRLAALSLYEQRPSLPRGCMIIRNTYNSYFVPFPFLTVTASEVREICNSFRAESTRNLDQGKLFLAPKIMIQKSV